MTSSDDSPLVAASSSPERLMAYARDPRLSTGPMKGTAP